ncbi:PIN domain-containing protein [Marispirochaeta sp.]|uniref:PIN domain-containing protein n=1 Tax=Marispirochaeta sp. TaxID=2038653 RepID=UPI0029C62128|nr:PIN domain-containing protein [Marispirochaeta sp.]
MKYLFDTDTVSTLLKPSPPQYLKERIALVPPSDQYLSTITILEITYGAYRSQNPRKYLDFLEQYLLPRVRILSFDDTAARIAGRIRASREADGAPISALDLQIAATASANGCILVTDNTRHFMNIPGLDIENWLI